MAVYNRKQIGMEAEMAALRFLEAQNLTLLQRNFTCHGGEIDLIMQDKNAIVFVEVRKRGGIEFGHAIESVNHSKIQKLIKTATYFLQLKNWLHTVDSRFDVVGIGPSKTGDEEIVWIKNAFTMDV